MTVVMRQSHPASPSEMGGDLHDYAIDRHPKQKVVYFLAFAAIVVAPYVNSWLALLLDGADTSKLPLATAVPVATLFGGIFWLFNQYLWRWAPIRKFLLVPDLNGTWTCIGKTITKEGQPFEFDWTAKITIVQSWSRMQISLATERSRSGSVAASLSNEHADGFKLIYYYKNDPAVTERDLHRHGGSCQLLFDPACQSATGSYFTDQERATVGTMSLRRDAR